MAEFVRIRHPQIEGEAAVVPDALPYLQAKGWQPVDGSTAPAPPSTSEPPAAAAEAPAPPIPNPSPEES